MSQPADPAPLNYSSPFAPTTGEFWANGQFLFVRHGATLPLRCIACNGTDHLKTKRKALTWAAPWLYFLLIFPGLLLGAIIIAICQKRATIHVSTCRHCRKKSLKHALIAWAIALLGILSFFLAAYFESGYLVLAGILLILGALFYGVFAMPLFTTKRIDDRVVIIKGAATEYLQSL